MRADHLDASGGFSSDRIRLDQASITGSAIFDGAALGNGEAVALSGRGLNVGQFLSCSNGFASNGAIDLIGATIGNALIFTGATLRRPGGFALDAQSASIGFALFLGSSYGDPSGFSAYGGIRLVGARIDGFICCWGGRRSDDLLVMAVPCRRLDSHLRRSRRHSQIDEARVTRTPRATVLSAPASEGVLLGVGVAFAHGLGRGWWWLGYCPG